MFRLIFGFILVALFTSCKKEQTKPAKPKNQGSNVLPPATNQMTNQTLTARPTEAFLTASDLQAPASLEIISEIEVKNKIMGDSNFFNETTDDDSFPCPALEQFPIVAAGDTIKAIADLDITPCMINTNPGATVTSVRYKFAWVVTCKNVDMSRYAGKNISWLQKSDELESACNRSGREFAFIVNSKSEVKLTVTSSGQSTSADFTQISATQDSQGRMCSQQPRNGTFVHNECSYIDITRYASPSFKSSYSRVQEQSVIGISKQPFYNSGKFAFTINNWTGDLVHRGQTTPPLLTARYGSNTINAVPITYNPALSLSTLLPRSLPEVKIPRLRL